MGRREESFLSEISVILGGCVSHASTKNISTWSKPRHSEVSDVTEGLRGVMSFRVTHTEKMGQGF